MQTYYLTMQWKCIANVIFTSKYNVMAITKNPLIRYKILDRCFSNSGKKYFIEDLIEECRSVLIEINPNAKGISRRQILDDISFMESSEGWNISLNRGRVGKRVFYRYADLSFSINSLPFGIINLAELKDAIELISSLSGFTLFEGLSDLLGSHIGYATTTKYLSKSIGFDENPFLNGINKLGSIYQNIKNKQVLEIGYQDFKSDKPNIIIFHPYYLKQYNNRWYIFGFNSVVGKYDWNLAIDRIVGIRVLENNYIDHPNIDWQEYFDDIIGVTRYTESKVEVITLRFYGETCMYVTTKPLHGSQRVRWITDMELEVKLELKTNSELEKTILSYGSNVKVIEPQSLAKRIKEIYSNALINYKSI